ncbi:hypothetical protein KL925_001878 [Ogataea polymorpha]|nr:hypothetical protein KL925_001878 [Ogataea polymorpha]
MSCLACRSRKIQCDGAKPRCLRCLKSNVPCYYKPQPTDFLACIHCKRGRRRCSRTKPACDRCRQLGKKCEYPSAVAVQSIEVLDALYEAPISEIDMLCESTIRRDPPFFAGNFLDRRFISKLRGGQVSMPLAKAVAGLSLDLVVPEHRLVSFSNYWYERLLSDSLLSLPSLDHLQALLITLICARSSIKHFLLIPVLSRMAYGLILNHELNWIKDPFEKERRRRMVWNIFVLDKIYAAGVPEFVSCDINLVSIHPPSTNPTSEPSPFCTQLPRYVAPFNLFSLVVHLAQLQYNTMNAVKLVERGSGSLEDVAHDMHLTLDLLPDNLRYSAANVEALPASQRSLFINMHLLLLLNQCNLNRLEGPARSLDLALAISSIARDNSDILANSRTTITLAFALFEASRIMLHAGIDVKSNMDVITGAKWADPDVVNIFLRDLRADRHFGGLLSFSELHPAHNLSWCI